MQNAECIMQNRLPALYFPMNRGYSSAPEFRLAVLIEQVTDKQGTCPASKLMRERYPPTPPFHCGENEIQVSPISSTSVGATPTPATNLGRCSGCRSVKPVSQTTVGSDDWSITSTSHHFGS